MSRLHSRFRLLLVSTLVIALVLTLAACRPRSAGDQLRGEILIDGSSTVYPVASAAAEDFMDIYPRVRVNVGFSGTGAGFERFTRGETDISDASREIRDSEREALDEAGVDFVRFHIAYDGLSVMVNPENDFVDCLTVEELRRIWEPGSQINNWNQVRDGFPDLELKLYGPGTDSGTFDYFTEEIVGESGASRSDYTANEDDNILVQGISGDRGSLGYFGYAYYVQNSDQLKLLGVDNGSGCVLPNPDTIENQEYSPLSRPLFMYVKASSLEEKPELVKFLEFVNSEEGQAVIDEVGYVRLTDEAYQENIEKLQPYKD